MKFAAVALALLLAFASASLVPSSPAYAHPLGNFTINRYARVELSPGSVHVRYVIDMAEIPAFTEISRIDTDKSGALSDAEKQTYADQRAAEFGRNLKLAVNGDLVALSPATATMTLPEGQAGLNTIRIVVDYNGALAAGWEKGVSASFKDGNFSDRLGWKEIVIVPESGVALTATSASETDISQELTAYPQDKLKSPLDVREASFKFAAGDSAALPAAMSGSTGKTSSAPAKSANGFARLIEREQLSVAFVALSLLAAMAWGAAHALGPGHGKTIVAAYLVGERGTAKHAVILGLTVTLTHTSTVITLGLVTLYASRFVATQDLYLWLSVGSGVLVILMGVVLFFSRFRRVFSAWRRSRATNEPLPAFSLTLPKSSLQPAMAVAAATTTPSQRRRRGAVEYRDDFLAFSHGAGGSAGLATGGDFAHAHGGTVHAHALDAADAHGDDFDGHGHSHLPPAPGLRGLIALGISGGLLPCPTALVVMLAAIALDRIAYGLVLIFAFSFGLAGVLTGIGILLVYARRAMDGEGRFGGVASRIRIPALVFQVAPLASAVVITIAGFVLTTSAISAL